MDAAVRNRRGYSTVAADDLDVLRTYFAEMEKVEVLSSGDEQEATKNIEALELNLWRELLSSEALRSPLTQAIRKAAPKSVDVSFLREPLPADLAQLAVM